MVNRAAVFFVDGNSHRYQRFGRREAITMEEVHRPQCGTECGGLTGSRILIVEDQAEIARLLEFAVTDAGGEVVAVATTMGKALELIRFEAISIAVVTKVVRGVHADVVARELLRRGIPYIVTAGSGASRGHPELRAALTITKPFQKGYVQAVLVDIAARSAAPPRMN